MRNPSTVSALAVVSSHEIRAGKEELALLQGSIVSQMRVLSRLREEEALRGLLVGLSLWRIKASMAHGTFGPWLKANSVAFGERYLRYMMKLACAFVAKARVTPPDILALPGAQTELALDGLEAPQRRFVEKAVKFVGKHSLHELFLAHGIKEAKKLGGLREKGEAPAAPVLDAGQLSAHAKAELSAAVEALRQLLLTDNVCQHLEADEVRALDQSLAGILSRWRAGLKKTLDH
jgi:hypothetical protein